MLESEGNLVCKACNLRETPGNETYNAWELPSLGKSEDRNQMLSFGEFPAVERPMGKSVGTPPVSLQREQRELTWDRR